MDLDPDLFKFAESRSNLGSKWPEPTLYGEKQPEHKGSLFNLIRFICEHKYEYKLGLNQNF